MYTNMFDGFISRIFIPVLQPSLKVYAPFRNSNLFFSAVITENIVNRTKNVKAFNLEKSVSKNGQQFGLQKILQEHLLLDNRKRFHWFSIRSWLVGC